MIYYITEVLRTVDKKKKAMTQVKYMYNIYIIDICFMIRINYYLKLMFNMYAHVTFNINANLSSCCFNNININNKNYYY